MELNNEKLVIYFGTFQEPKNLAEVAEDLYGEKKDSVRSSFSKKKALEEMLEEGLITAKKEGGWKFKANEEKLKPIICHLIEHGDEEINQIKLTREDADTIEQMFQKEDVRKFLNNEKLSNVLGDKLSLAKRNLATYIKLLYTTLAGSRILIEDLELQQVSEIRLNEEAAERLRYMIKIMDFASQESPVRIGAIFEEITTGTLEINLMELPRTDSEMVNTVADQVKAFLTEEMGMEIQSMVEIDGGHTAATT